MDSVEGRQLQKGDPMSEQAKREQEHIEIHAEMGDECPCYKIHGDIA